MTRYALVDPQDAINRFATNVDPSVQTKSGWRWLLAPMVARPAYDPLTQKVTGPTYTVGASEVTEAYGVASLTAQEISDFKDAAVTSALEDTQLYPVLFNGLFNMNNRIRALEGQGSLTKAQYKAAIKNLL
jgi:hypothetical protein